MQHAGFANASALATAAAQAARAASAASSAALNVGDVATAVCMPPLCLVLHACELQCTCSTDADCHDTWAMWLLRYACLHVASFCMRVSFDALAAQMLTVINYAGRLSCISVGSLQCSTDADCHGTCRSPQLHQHRLAPTRWASCSAAAALLRPSLPSELPPAMPGCAITHHMTCNSPVHWMFAR